MRIANNMNKTIFLCASMNFYKELVDVEEKLEKKGWVVGIPISAGIMKKKNEFYAMTLLMVDLNLGMSSHLYFI